MILPLRGLSTVCLKRHGSGLPPVVSPRVRSLALSDSAEPYVGRGHVRSASHPQGGGQVGRIYDGGACAIGFATSTNNGATWTSGLLPGITKWTAAAARTTAPPTRRWPTTPGTTSGSISSLTLLEAGGVHGNAVVTSRSTDGGLTWGNPVTDGDRRRSRQELDRLRQHRDQPVLRQLLHAVGRPRQRQPAADEHVHRRRPDLVGADDEQHRRDRRPAGRAAQRHRDRPDRQRQRDRDRRVQLHQRRRVAGARSRRSRRSATTRSPAACARVRCPPPRSTAPARSTSPGRTAASARCKTNDIVLSHSLNATGTSWSAVTRVPIDATSSSIDHFIPGLAVNKATSGSTRAARPDLLLLPARAARQLSVGFISSTNGGSTWSAPQTADQRDDRRPGPPPRARAAWSATTSRPRYGSDNLAHGIFGAATHADDRDEPARPARSTTASRRSSTFGTGAGVGRRCPRRGDPVLFSGNGGTNAASLWNVVDNNGSKHRD